MIDYRQALILKSKSMQKACYHLITFLTLILILNIEIFVLAQSAEFILKLGM